VAERKVIVVTGATGAQGGGLARAILAEPEAGFTVRALTRDADSEAARALAAAGAEIVSADLDDPASLERAFEGAYGAYCVTFFWAHFSPDKEQAQARSMAQAAKSAGLRHVIWSTLEDTRRWLKLDDPRMPTLMERYKVPHFDAKGESDDFFRQAGVPTTFMLTSYYWDNLIHFGMGPKPGPDGTLLLALPMGDRKLPGIAAEDIGRCAWGIFKQGEGLAGRTIGIAGEHLTGAEMAASLGRALGREVRYAAIPPDAYRALGFPGSDDLGNMFQFKHDFNEEFCAARSIETSRSLNPRLMSFDDWLSANVAKIPLT
jgi:uncharacterized protein YbjT (DUF2867 family)